MRRILTLAFLLPLALFGQIHLIPVDGSTDTATTCAGVLADGGGVNGNYNNYDNGYFVIDPPGAGTVSLVFTSFATYHSSDVVYVYDGVGTSGTLLGYYWGSTLPNSGNAITSTSGAITVRFYSNYYGVSSGFQCSWSTNQSTVPNASFTSNSTSISYNTPLQFVNTTTGGGGNYWWDFGDGTYSTETNPLHAFTTSGTQTITMVASNCAGSDTATLNINVGAAPNASTSSDTIHISVPCGTTASSTWTVSNATGAGNLSLATDLYDTNYVFRADFEDGTLEGFSTVSTNVTLSNTTSTAAQGTHALQISGYYSSSQTVYASFNTSQPTRLSYDTKVNSGQGSSGYTWFSDPSNSYITATPFAYTYWNTSSLRIGYRQNGGFSTYYHYTTANEWVNVEYNNIDWTAKTFDILVNGSTVVTGAQFYNLTATGVNGIHGYQYSTAYVHYLDDIQVQGGTSIDLSYSPLTATVAGGNNVVFNFTVDATDLFSGSYYLELILTSNDTSLNGMHVPMIVDVTGEGVWETNKTACTSLSTYTGAVSTDTVQIWNSGCDSLIVAQVGHSSSRISGNTGGFVLAPNDTIKYGFTWSSGVSGTFADTLYFQENDSTYFHCIAASVQDGPSIAMDSTVFNVFANGCPDTVTVPYWIYNDGQQTLNFENVGVPTAAPPACPFTIQLTDSYGDGWNGAKVDLIDSEGHVLYTLGTTFYSGYLYNESVMLCSGETYSIVVTAVGGYKSEIGLKVIENNTVISTYTNTSSTNLGTQMAQFSANCGIPCSNPSTLVFDPTTGSISTGDSQLVYMKIYTDSLLEDTYQYSAYVKSNDPVDSNKVILVILTIDGVSETYVNRSSCFDLDTLTKGGTYVDSVFVENIGCDSLYFTSISTSDASFTAAAAYAQIGVSDSGWVIVSINPTAVGSIQDTVYVTTSDTTWPLCYTGYVAEAPTAWANTNPIAISTVNCGDSVSFDVSFGNSTASTKLDWNLTTGEVLNVLVVNANVYPSLYSNFQSYLNTAKNIAVKTVTSVSAVTSELPWADVVIFPPVTNSSLSSDYTAIQTQMSDWINDGGKMLVMGSQYVDNILAMNFINGYYYGNYTGYTHYVNTGANHPYVQGLPSTFVTQSASLDAYIYNTGYTYLVYNAYYRQALSYFPLGAGEVIYYGFNFNTVYTEITTILDNIFSSTLSDKATGLDWMTYSPSAGTTQGGDTTTVTVWAHSDTLSAGTYTMNLNILTNDPIHPKFSIPVTFTVNGKGAGLIDVACEDFGNVYQNMTHNANVPVYNVGCDTLEIVGAATGGSAFSTTTSISMSIAPGDTGFVPVSLYQTTLGSVSDSLWVYSTVDTVARCLTATIVGASDISVSPSSIDVTINKCNGFKTVPYTITNNGQAALTYEVSVAQVYDSTSTQNWLYPAPNYSNTQVHTFNNIITSDTIFYEIILNGEYSQTNNYFYLYANGSYVQTLYDNNVTNYTNDTISGFITGWQLTNIMNAGYLTIQLYSYNYNAVSGQSCAVHVWQKKHVTWAAPVGVATGTVAAGVTVNKSILVTVTNLALGTYQTSVIFETNDPQDPIYQIPMTVHVVSSPDMSLGTSFLSFGSVYSTVPVQDSVLVENDGCVNLTITNITSNNSHFVPNWTSKTITPGNSAWLPVTFTATNPGAETGMLTITNNDSVQFVQLSANVIFAPVADFQYQVQNACTGNVNFNNESTNGGQYQWAFGDGSFSAQVNPSHTYTKPGTYSVMLVTSNAGGTDTIYKSIQLNDVLYVASEFPDTVQAGTIVQFIDSCMYAIGWQWYFGDGGNSTTPNPQHTYANKGTYIVTLIATNSAGCTGNSNKAIVVKSGVGMEELDPSLWNIFPNPTTGRIQLEVPAARTLEIYSSSGELLFEDGFTTSLDLSHLASGAYTIVVKGDDFIVRQRLTIVH